MPTNADVRKLRVSSSMSLEEAMAEVRRYLRASGSVATDSVQATNQYSGGSNASRSSQFPMQAAMITRLSEIAARLGEVEPHSKLGTAGVLLKRMVRKAIGWYSRPVHEFDRTAIELLQQIRHDMLGLQQQIASQQQEMANPSSTAPVLPEPGIAPRVQNRESEQSEL
jgi:hypothetical protein